MKTESVMVQNLCVPCACRCRYCLLSWDGKPVGVSWERGAAFAERFLAEAKAAAPELRCAFAFGYSMEHPHLREALRFLRRIGSPQADFLQCDGMKQRNEQECAALTEMLAAEGVRHLNVTLYGLPAYHDRFAGRPGDFDLLTRLLAAAAAAGLRASVGVPLTKENVSQADELVALLRNKGSEAITLFIPHEEGRGAALAQVRLEKGDLDALSSGARGLLNPRLYRTEGAWVAEKNAPEETKRALMLSLTPGVIDRYEQRSAPALIREIEALDDQYYAAYPAFGELAERYGDPSGEKLYRKRDLFAHYRKLFAREYGVAVYDVTDERQSGSRRY